MFYRSCLLLLFTSTALALEPDQIALVVNANVPASRKLADFYAAQRHIPTSQIIELSLNVPNPATPPEDISPADYDAHVAPVVRDFLKKQGLEKKVTCLVTFWGVPLRVGRRSLDDADKKEMAELKGELDAVHAEVTQQVKSAEEFASQLDPAFHASPGADLDSLARRGEIALNAILRQLQKIADAHRRGEIYAPMMKLVRDLAGQPAVAEKLSQQDFWKLAPTAPKLDEVIAARDHSAELQTKVNALNGEPQSRETRVKTREFFKAELGTLNLARLISSQIKVIDNVESEAAFDSELALIWWPPYPKAKWELNPLNWKVAGRLALPSQTLMVMRLDGPSEQSVHDIIETSIKIEQEGLSGEVVLDARGKPPTEPYGAYDQTLRNLAEMLRAKSSLKVVLDDKPALLSQDSESDIALYCGWYSLRHYVAPGSFHPGAVGFHVASSEMVSLHNSKETGWCHNLIKAGEVATLGPVAEPYLQSFPPADEFFPLLLTGKLTLADVYWETTPWVSWMQCCVGDPLYTPYKVHPALKREDLPEVLKPLIP